MRVLILEDNALLGEGLRLILERGGHEVTLRDSVDGLDGVLDGNYAELLIADVRLPPTYRDEGLVAALAARRRYPGLRVLVLSSFVQVEYAAELLADPQGGVGYLLKDRIGEVDDFLSAVGRVMSGETAIDPEVVAASSVGALRIRLRT